MKKTKICAPGVKDSFTCFSKKGLVNILNSLNKNNEKKIKFSSKSSKRELWSKINNKFKQNCSDEYCWIKQPSIKKNKYILKTKKNIFRPEMPSHWKKNISEWLSTEDIENVLNQYEKKYKDFIFIGAVPIDFDHKFTTGNCVINELCNINIKSLLRKNKTKIGIVFNLDPHDKDGSHWVSFFCDLKKCHIYFFDSYGYNPPKEVTKLIERIKDQGEKLNKKFKVSINKMRHQYKDSECGMYSIDFIERLLRKVPFHLMSKRKIKDELVQKKRYKYFINT